MGRSLPEIHSILPSRLGDELDEILPAAGIAHRRHDGENVVAAAEDAAGSDAIALIGPFRSRDVAEAVEAIAPAELALIAPVATWAGVTRDDEPGCDDHPADHRATVFRLVARDTVVAARIAADVASTGRRALVIAGDHDYGLQLDGQLRLAGIPRADDPDDADLVILCGLADEPEIERSRSLAPLPVLAFDGVQGADLGEGRDVQLALPYAPDDQLATDELLAGVGQARRAAELAVTVASGVTTGRVSFLEGLRALDSFDEYGDPVRPPVWLWRAGPDWSLTPERQLGD